MRISLVSADIFSASVICPSVMRTSVARHVLAKCARRWFMTSPHCILLSLSHSNQNIHNNHHPSTPSQQPNPKQATAYHQATEKEIQPTHSLKMASTNLTDNDRKLLAAAWHCFETQPKVSSRLYSSKQHIDTPTDLARTAVTSTPFPSPKSQTILISQQTQRATSY
jgi:hypothetical protein